MLPVQLALLKTIAVSALGLQLVHPILPAESNSTPNLALPNGLQAATDASLLSNSSSTVSGQWDGTIALPLNVPSIPLSALSSSDPYPLWNDTFLSTFNASAGPRPRPGPKPGPDLPPLPSGWTIVCNERLGTGMKSSSCLDAWTLLPPIESIVSFGPRNAATKYDVGLPKRYLSSDGTCFIEPVLLNAGTVAHVKPTDAGIAALYVIRRCVGAHPPLGGASKNDGGTDDLAVMVSKFVPGVVCSAQPYSRDSAVFDACEAIVDQMETSKQEKIFAQVAIHDPNLETPLPAWYKAPAETPKCILRVTGSKSRQFANWYEIWEAATAITAMCIRQGKGGSWTGVGYSESLVVTMGKVPRTAISQE